MFWSSAVLIPLVLFLLRLGPLGCLHLKTKSLSQIGLEPLAWKHWPLKSFSFFRGVWAMPYEICVKNRHSHGTMISLLSELRVATVHLRQQNILLLTVEDRLDEIT